jgi:CheY-like chemotaxis protein
MLVVEDDPAVRQIAVSSLGELGYQVHEAPDGKAALDILHSGRHFDLLFSDMIMPNGIDGQDLAKAARTLRPQMKVVLASGYSEQFIAMRGEVDQDIKLLSKPYRRDVLARAVRDALNGAA